MLLGVPDCLVAAVTLDAATSPHAAAVAYGTIVELVWHDGDDEVGALGGPSMPLDLECRA